MAILVIRRPGQVEQSVHLDDLQVTVGRLEDNELTIDDRSVSRRHAVITRHGDAHTITDLGSRNGMWVNGRRTRDKPVVLRPGDEVALGNQGVVLRYLTDELEGADVTGVFTVPSWMDSIGLSQGLSAPLTGGKLWDRLLRITPWLRLAGAATGAMAAVLALTWWILRFLAD